MNLQYRSLAQSFIQKLFCALVLASMQPSFAQGVTDNFTAAKSYNGKVLLLTELGVRYELDEKPRKPQLLSVTHNERAIVDAAEDRSANMRALIVDKGDKLSLLVSQQGKAETEVELPEAVQHLNEKHWLFCCNDSVILVTPSKTYTYSGGKWRELPWSAPEKLARWFQYWRTADLSLSGEKLFVLFRGGEWGSAILSFDLSRHSWKKEYEAGHTHSQLEMQAGQSGRPWLLLDRHLSRLEPDGKLKEVLVQPKDLSSIWLSPTGVLFSSDESKVYRLENHSLSAVVNIKAKSDSSVPAQSLAGKLPAIGKLRLLYVGEKVALFESPLLFVNTETGSSQELKVGTETADL